MNQIDYSSLPDVLTVPELAAILRVNRNTIYDALNRGDIPYIKIGKSYRIPKPVVISLLTAGNSPVSESSRIR